MYLVGNLEDYGKRKYSILLFFDIFRIITKWPGYIEIYFGFFNIFADLFIYFIFFN